MGKGNCRSLHYATPDFLSGLVALANFMRLSLGKPHTRPLVALRSRKSGYAAAGMTNLTLVQKVKVCLADRLTLCHPDRSVA
jgi:hypothetical protein